MIMPKLWNETIEEHRRAVYEATLDATAALASEHGLLSVTMSQIAAETGIGRATLYKYFPDVETILTAWHKRQIASHLDQLVAIRDHAGTPRERLESVLKAYASMSHEHHDAELTSFLHRGDHLGEAEQHLRGFIEELLTNAAGSGDVRTDITAAELANYCLHALKGADNSLSAAAVGRLVELTLDGLRAH